MRVSQLSDLWTKCKSVVQKKCNVLTVCFVYTGTVIWTMVDYILLF